MRAKEKTGHVFMHRLEDARARFGIARANSRCSQQGKAPELVEPHTRPHFPISTTCQCFVRSCSLSLILSLKSACNLCKAPYPTPPSSPTPPPTRLAFVLVPEKHLQGCGIPTRSNMLHRRGCRGCNNTLPGTGTIPYSPSIAPLFYNFIVQYQFMCQAMSPSRQK